MEKREIEAIVRKVMEKMAETKGFQEAPYGSEVAGSGSAVMGGRPDSRAADSRASKPAAANGGRLHVTMPLSLAVKLIEKVEEKAAEWDMRVVAAVSDAAGRPVAVHCMDGAYIGSFDVALNKAYTSIAFQMSTAQLGRLSSPGESLYGIQFTNEGRIVIFGGGEVLERDGVIIGALGVSGGSAEQDTALAAYGKSIVRELE